MTNKTSAALLPALVAMCLAACSAQSSTPTPPPSTPGPLTTPTSAASASTSVPASASASTTVSPPLAAPSAPAPRPASFATRRSLAGDGASSFGAAADERYAYGVAYQGPLGVFRAPRGGGALEVLAGAQEWSRDLAVNDTTLYWVKGHGATPGGGVYAMPKAGGGVRDFAPHQADAHLIAVDATHVYWANGGGYDGSGAIGKAEIRRMAKRGGPIEIVAEIPGVVSLRLADDGLYVLADSMPPTGAGILAKVPKSGGAVVVLAPSGPSPADLDLDDTHAYWTIRGEFEMPPPIVCKKNTPCPVATTAPIVRHGEVHRVPRAGGPVEVLTRDLRDAGSLVLGARSILFSAGAELFEMPKAGGPKVNRGAGVSSRFAVSGGEVFAVSNGQIVAFGP